MTPSDKQPFDSASTSRIIYIDQGKEALLNGYQQNKKNDEIIKKSKDVAASLKNAEIRDYRRPQKSQLSTHSRAAIRKDQFTTL